MYLLALWSEYYLLGLLVFLYTPTEEGGNLFNWNTHLPFSSK